MTRFLEQEVAAISALPEIQLSTEEDADLAEAEKESARGELASEAEMAALWAKYRA